MGMSDWPKMEWQGCYAICFDFPEFDGEPLFAGWTGGIPRYARTLATAMRFPTDSEAEAMLRNSYGKETRTYGVVVEVRR